MVAENRLPTHENSMAKIRCQGSTFAHPEKKTDTQKKWHHRSYRW